MSSRIYSIPHDVGHDFPQYEWGWFCSCGADVSGYWSATDAQDSLDQHAAFCREVDR